MSAEDIVRLYPAFSDWLHGVKGYMTASGVYLIKLWYEWLRSKENEIGEA